MYLQTITRSGVPNVNGIVYSKESFNKMREYQKDIVFSLCKCKENYTSELSIVKLEDEIGKITGIYDGSISVDIYDQYKEYIYDALASGYLPAMRYIANVSEPNKDNISEVTNMYLICYDLIKIPNITINPEEKIVPATIENINKALGIELAEYQISYIFSDDYTIMYGGRYTGKTLAFIIKNLIRLDRQLSLININDIHNSVSKGFIFPYEYNLHNSNINYISNQYPRMVYDVYKKFHDAGIRTSLDKYFNDRELK